MISSVLLLIVIVTGKVIAIMGVSGAGKSTIGKMLGKALSCDFLDADDFHSLSNRGNRIDITFDESVGKISCVNTNCSTR
jgi:uridine kinase